MKEAQVNLDLRNVLLRLREIGRRMPPVDAVQLTRESREQLEQRGSVQDESAEFLQNQG